MEVLGRVDEGDDALEDGRDGVGAVRVGERLGVRLPGHGEHPAGAVHELDAVVGLGVVRGGDDDARGAAGDVGARRGERAAAEHRRREHVALGAEARGAVGEDDARAVRGPGRRILLRRRDETGDVHGRKCGRGEKARGGARGLARSKK